MRREKTRIDPWARDIVIEDYKQQITDWGLSPFDDELIKNVQKTTTPLYLMKRGILFAHRDFDIILDCIEKKKLFVMITGLMPSGKMHLGHKLIVDQMKWYQENGADLVIAISDIEAWMARGMPPSVTTKIAIEEYITNYLALGIDYKKHKVEIYSQWMRPELLKLSMAFSGRKTFGEMNSIYGFIKPTANYIPSEDLKKKPTQVFDWSISAGKTFFPFIQVADILHPQLKRYGGPRPVVVPVGIDQDPHLRLTRDIAEKWRVYNFVITEENGYVAIYTTDREKADESLDSLEKALVDMGIEKYTMTENGEKEANITRMPNATAILIRNKAVSDMSWIQDYLRDYLDRDYENYYFSNNRIGIFVRADKNIEKLLSLARDTLKNLGYNKMDVIPKYRALYLYDNTDIKIKKIEESLITIESDLGLPVFYKPASTYNKLIRGLTGGKMSSSDLNSAIFLTDSPDVVEYKIKNAQTGGRETITQQKEKGGEPTKCMIYELLLFNHPSDEFVKNTYASCVSGSLTCSECKQKTIEYFKEWIMALHDRREKLILSGELEALVDSQDIIKKGDPLWW